ncbi:hypothetical protein [Enterobacter cloacae]|uniref:hypothetical protein n=1 Tax=Enterobacter cloacae TaxID=550 RepID=UPI0031DBCBDA
MPAFEWVHVQLHQQKGMISLSPPTICNSAGICALLKPVTRLSSSPTDLTFEKPPPQVVFSFSGFEAQWSGNVR